ncbi:PhoH family protein [Deferribacterales bacterium Es71-Z0220]|uniref:PhoH family protein n=1 Tax=Deferrivibrio essentukiensis TaxID=2880922 RepID=UPI001F61AF94|nr:PhoH family protein [Deferrivibrio essentukiensis]MCB4204035.1 PhoH family protein [Deferrivibrio essentukiensis]
MTNYVLDTNVLLYDPNAVYGFNGDTLNIPITVIEEIDYFKKNMDQTGYNARYIARFLDELRKEGDLREGVKLENGTTVRVNVCNDHLASKISSDLIKDKADNLILSVALWLQEHEKKEVIFVTKDANLRIKSDVLGIKSIDYEKDRVETDRFFEGTKVIAIKDELVDKLYNNEVVKLEKEFLPNEYLRVESELNPKKSVLVRFDKISNGLVKIKEYKDGLWGIIARNSEQRFLYDALTNDSIKLVCIAGIAGTGKTLLAIAAGLAKTIDEKKYRKLLVSRPIFPMGKDLGFLPGEIKDKLAPWMQPVYDNLSFILENTNEQSTYKELFEQNLVEIEALTYIRGRSIPNQYFIVDEAQNLTPHEIKTILTRAGEGTKIVLTGDPNQIDNPYIDYYTNGLTYVMDRFKDDEIAAAVTLLKGERSILATKAAQKL